MASALGGGAQEAARGTASALRAAARLLTDEPATPSVPPQGVQGLAQQWTDAATLSLARAAAPYALGGAGLLAALAAVRALVKPLEQVVRSVALLLLCLWAAENWGAIYAAFELVSGQNALYPM